MNEQTSESNILVVDDKPENLRLLSKILKAQGYIVRSLRKGQMVFSSALNSPPDIILLDILMPDMDGYEVCKQLKADERTRDIPIIFISALNQAAGKTRGFDLGGIDYITKPFEEEEVLARVKNHLSLRNILRRLEEKNAQLARAEKNFRRDEERLNALFKFSQMNIPHRELAAMSLEEVICLTRSEVGYLHFVNPDQKTIAFFSWSERTLENCTAVKDSHYPVDAAGVWAECVRERKPVIHNDYAALSCKKGLPEGHFPVRRHMSAPIFDGGQIVAIAGVGNKNDPYDEADVRQLTLFMRSIWEIFQRKRSEERRRRQNRYLNALHQISLELVGQTDLDLDDLLQNILNSAAGLTNVSDGFIYLSDPENDSLKIRFAIGAFSKHIGFCIGPGQGLAGKVFQTGQPLLIEDYRTWEGRVADSAFDLLGFVAGIPLKSEGMVTGVIGIASGREEGSIGAEDIQVLELFAKLASVALNNARLYTTLKNEIGEHRKTGDALRESEALFRFQFEYGNIGIAVTSVEKGWLRVNPKLLGMLGYSESELRRKTWVEMTHPDDLAADTEQYERLLAGEIEAYEIDKRFFRKDKSILEANMTVSCCRNKDGSVRIVVASLQDIMERKRHEEELRKAKEAAEAASLTKSEFLANMSHEIRTPMNSVLGFLELALDDPLLPQVHRNHLNTAHNSAKSLLTLINDILDVSKLESGRLELENTPFDLIRTTEDALRVFRIKAREKGLNLSLEIPPDLPRYYMGDPSRLRQIIVNLVGNALKFTEKGEISVAVSATGRENMLHFSVSDTGIGIPSERVDKIFDPFTQADGSTARRFGGTGLGTTISRQLAELMRGEIWAESEEGKGSSFHFTIRTKPTDVIPESEPECVFSGSGRCFRILVAEDIEENIMLAKIRLGECGHTVIEARNGREAVEAFQKESPDIILMDVHMPETDGLEAARIIREAETDSDHIPIVALTASVMKEEQKKCLEAGMDAVAGKPVDFEELFTLMEQLIPEGAGSPAVGGRRSAVSSQQSAVGSRQSVVGSQQSVVGSQHFEGINIEKGLRIWQDSELYQKALLGFSRDYRDAADKILNSVRAGDRDEAYRIAHALKGVAGNLSITKVYSIVAKLSVALGKKDSAVLIPMIESLAVALNSAVDSIRQLVPEPDYNSEEKPESPKDPGSFQKLRGLFRKLLNSFEEYNPAAAEPFLEELSNSLSQRQTGSIRKEIDRFDFDEAKEKTVRLAADLGIQL
ncbi:response regulator [Desulfococcaceae bacterium HSG8]|nr:response regulator [Desulfococcaceae bacterium HSG8]